MNSIKEKVYYIKGLVDGLDLSETSAEGKVLVKVVDVLECMAQQIEELEDAQAEMDDYITCLDEDLSELEEEIYADDCCDCDDCDDDCDCCDCYDEDDISEVECPNCHETIYFDSDLLDSDDELECPDCGTNLFAQNEEE